MFKLIFNYDSRKDVLTVEGINFAGQFFRDFARDIPLETAIKIVKREDGIIWIERVNRQ